MLILTKVSVERHSFIFGPKRMVTLEFKLSDYDVLYGKSY